MTRDMALAMHTQLLAWQDDPAVKAVVVQGAGGKAFCAGGDIRAIVEKGIDHAQEFFTAEYELVRLIHHYPKPYIALVDGIAMGGGAGISINGRYCIVTERALFAMPETAIGFYPDVAAGYFLPRLAGQTGVFLALTGARLRADDLCHTGLATHAVPSFKLPELLQALATGEVDAALADYALATDEADLPKVQDAIDRCFAGDTVEEIITALEAENSAWGRATAAALLRLSPTALKVTLRHMRHCAALTFDQVIDADHRLTHRFIGSADFREGVRAALIDKDKTPRWQPPALADVTEEMVDGFLKANLFW